MADDQSWAIQRRLDDQLTKLEGEYGTLKGRVEVSLSPDVTFGEIGGLAEAKQAIRGLSVALVAPERYKEWGITPPKGALLYGPPGTGKTLLARGLSTLASAIFYHLKLTNITSKHGPKTAELIQDVLALAPGEGKAVVFLDEIDALCLEHLLPPEQAREASCQLVASFTEKLDAMGAFSNVVVLGATNRPDVIDPAVIAPGRLDRLIEVPLPEGAAIREIGEIHQTKAEQAAGRHLFEPLAYPDLLPRLAGMSGAEIAEIIRRALEGKVQQAAGGESPGLVTIQDVQREIDGYRRIKEVVEKIRYGQYL
jgi:transitional endoplasmic reticulum ATPase